METGWYANKFKLLVVPEVDHIDLELASNRCYSK